MTMIWHQIIPFLSVIHELLDLYKYHCFQKLTTESLYPRMEFFKRTTFWLKIWVFQTILFYVFRVFN